MIIYNTFHIHLDFRNGLFPSGYTTKILYTYLLPLRASYPVHFSLIMFAENTVYVTNTSPLLGSNIFLTPCTQTLCMLDLNCQNLSFADTK
jgi:hypothetical protein